MAFSSFPAFIILTTIGTTLIHISTTDGLIGITGQDTISRTAILWLTTISDAAVGMADRSAGRSADSSATDSLNHQTQMNCVPNHKTTWVKICSQRFGAAINHQTISKSYPAIFHVLFVQKQSTLWNWLLQWSIRFRSIQNKLELSFNNASGFCHGGSPSKAL